MVGLLDLVLLGPVLRALVSLQIVRLVEALTAAHAYKWLAVSVGELVPRERPRGWEAFAATLVVADVRHTETMKGAIKLFLAIRLWLRVMTPQSTFHTSNKFGYLCNTFETGACLLNLQLH